MAILRETSPAAILAAVACAVCMAIGLAPLFIGSFPVFLKPVSQEFGWGFSVFPQALMVSGLSGAIAGPFIGRLIDRYGVRTFMLPGLALWSASLFAFSFLPNSRIALYLLPTFMGVVAASAGPISFARVVSGWFDQNRGLVLGLVLSAAPAVATAIAVNASQMVIDHHGWRAAYQALGIAAAVLSLPLAYFFMREKSTAPRVNREPVVLPGLTAGEALRTRELWLLLISGALVCAAMLGITSHFVAWSAERGVSATAATLAVSCFSLAGPVGPVVAGFVADRFQTPKIIPIFYLFPCAGLAMVMFGGEAWAVPGMILMGFGFSAVTGLLPYLVTRYFGLKASAEIFGISLGIFTLAMGGSPVVIGFARDLSGDYRSATIAALVASVAAVFVALPFPTYRFKAGKPPE